uniref:Nucleotide-diphospho-sugar transferase domain-containing protein n=2 Tax=Hemiselmis andersenii TaxID=464988 RepID=A0A7S0XNY4_HEMAN
MSWWSRGKQGLREASMLKVRHKNTARRRLIFGATLIAACQVALLCLSPSSRSSVLSAMRLRAPPSPPPEEKEPAACARRDGGVVNCLWNHQIYQCAAGGPYQTEKDEAAPSGECLDGFHSWNVCRNRTFLCKAPGLSTRDVMHHFGHCPSSLRTNRTEMVVTRMETKYPEVDLEWWRSGGSSRVLVAQAVGLGNYQRLFAISSPAVRRWCMLHDYDYISAIGHFVGDKEWHSCFNKVFLLQLARKEMHNLYDFFFYMDADAVIVNPSFCVESILSPHQLLAAQVGGDRHKSWQKNDGVALYNLNHPLAQHLSDTWVQRSYSSIGNKSRTADQKEWYDILQTYGEEEGWPLRELLPVLPFAASDGSRGFDNVLHVIREDMFDWTGSSVKDRAERMRRAIAGIEWPREPH